MPLYQFLKKRKYEILLFGLFQHLFIGLFLINLDEYRNFIWPVNMIILGITSFGVFLEKNKNRLLILRLLVLIICCTPIFTQLIGFSKNVMIFLSLAYVVFFIYVLYEVMRFLLKPSYINADIISASGCGYFLLIEIATFTQQTIYYINPTAYKGLDVSHHTLVFIDFVYFSSITITSIGFGDILPNTHYAKLLTSLLGIVGQFYTVVLVGILISKFTSQNNK